MTLNLTPIVWANLNQNRITDHFLTALQRATILQFKWKIPQVENLTLHFQLLIFYVLKMLNKCSINLELPFLGLSDRVYLHMNL